MIKAKTDIFCENKMELVSGKLSEAYFLLTYWNISATYVAVLSRATGNSAMDCQVGIVKCCNSRVDQDFLNLKCYLGLDTHLCICLPTFWMIVSAHLNIGTGESKNAIN